MRKKLLILFTLCLSASLPHAKAVIYGSDDRRFVAKNQSSELVKKSARSILAQMRIENSYTEKDGSLVINAETQMSKYSVCSNSQYAEEAHASVCTAFLVAPDVVATAAHCVKTVEDCKKSLWAFDYTSGGLQIKTKAQNIVRCTEILATKTDNNQDYTFFKISKKITDRPILEFQREYEPNKKDELMIIGHPFGMPMMLTDNVKVKTQVGHFKVILKADTASGNSGSPVINKANGKVVGIFLNGDPDFNVNDVCRSEIKCGLFNCHRGEYMQLAWPLPLHLLK